MYSNSRTTCCPKCNGHGKVETTMEEYNELKDFSSNIDPFEKECSKCGGSGFVSEE